MWGEKKNRGMAASRDELGNMLVRAAVVEKSGRTRVFFITPKRSRRLLLARLVR